MNAKTWLKIVAVGALSLLFTTFHPLSGQPVSSRWTQIGTGIVALEGHHAESGRTRQAAWRVDDLQKRNVLWLGTVKGGLWRSTVNSDGNITSWIPLTDNFPGPHVMGSFLVSRWTSRLILIGPGGHEGNGDGNVYRTDTGGQDWVGYPLPAGDGEPAPTKIWRMVDDRSDATGNTLLACTNRGIYRSTDFGLNWHRVFHSVKAGPADEVFDIVQDTGDPATWYAAARYDHVMLRSTDSGKAGSWDKWFGAGEISGSVDRVYLTTCDLLPNLLYALVFTGDSSNTSAGGLNGVYRSMDHGKNWTNIFDDNDVVNSGNEGGHTGAIACDPANPNHLIFGVQHPLETYTATLPKALISWRGYEGKHKESTLDAGHGDFNYFLFRPQADSIVVCSDGGYYLYDPNTQYVDDTGNLRGLDSTWLSDDQGFLSVSRSKPNLFIAGLEDNGVIIGDARLGSLAMVRFCDGGQGSFMPDNPDVIASSTNATSGGRAESTDGGFSWVGIDNGLTGERREFPTVLIDPTPGLNNPFIFTYAPGKGSTNDVYFRLALDVSGPWVPVSQQSVSGTITHLDHTTDKNEHRIILTLENDRRLMAFVGQRSDLGNLQRTILHVPLMDLTNKVKDARANADKTALRPDTIYYTTGGSRPSQALYSDQGGEKGTWYDITGPGLPTAATFNKLIGNPRNPRQFFLATDQGVYRTDDHGQSWRPFSHGLRLNEDVTDIVISVNGLDVPRLIAATNGRGFWVRDIE